MRYPSLAFSAVALMLAGSSSLPAQGPQPDAKLLELRDSIRTLIEERNGLRSELTTAGLLDPTLITSASHRAFDDRIVVRFETNKLARARVTVETAAGDIRRVVTTDDHKDKHTVAVQGLVPTTQYFITIDALKNTRPAEIAVTRQGKNPAIASFDPGLRATTTALIDRPQLTAPTTDAKHNILTLSLRADQPVLYRASLYREIAGQAQGEPVTVGADFSRDEYGAPKASNANATGTLSFVGLEPATAYYYRVEAINKEGKTDDHGLTRVVTAPMPPPFRFVGPFNVRFDVARGLVVQWKASSPAQSGQILADFSPGNGDDRSQPAIISDGGQSLEAVLNSIDLLRSDPGANTAPIIKVQMASATGETLEMEMTFAVAMPKDRTSIPSLNLSKDNKDALLRAWDAAKNPGDDKKLRWNDVAATALKLLPVLF